MSKPWQRGNSIFWGIYLRDVVESFVKKTKKQVDLVISMFCQECTFIQFLYFSPSRMMQRMDKLKSSNALFPYVVQRRSPTDAPLWTRHKHQWWVSHTVVVRNDYRPFLMSTKHPWTDKSRRIHRLDTRLNKDCQETLRTLPLLSQQTHSSAAHRCSVTPLSWNGCQRPGLSQTNPSWTG